MKKILSIIGMLFITQLFSASLVFTTEIQPNIPQSKLTMQNLGQMPLAFTENQGQWDDKVLFRANAGGAIMWFTEEGVYYQFTRTISRDDAEPDDPIRQLHDRREKEMDSVECLMIKASFA